MISNLKQMVATSFLVSVCAAIGPVHAGTIALEITQSRDIGPGRDSTLGWSFTVNQAIRVTSLGIWDTFGDGLTTDHLVGLWNSDGSQLLATTTILSGTASPITDGFRFESITPVTLQSGQEYVLGAFYPDNSRDDYNYSADGSGLSFTTAGAITYGTARFVNSASFTFPSGGGDPAEAGRFGPNFLFASVPEPSGLVLLGMGLASLLSVGYRRLRHARARCGGRSIAARPRS